MREAICFFGWKSESEDVGFVWSTSRYLAEGAREGRITRGDAVTEIRVIKLSMLSLPADANTDQIEAALNAWPQGWALDRIPETAPLSEESVVRRELGDDPFVSNEDFGRLVEEAAEADEARMLRAEQDLGVADTLTYQAAHPCSSPTIAGTHTLRCGTCEECKAEEVGE